MEVKLSDVQVTEIAETLDIKGVVYEDIKSELVDHIASQIESLLENENLSYCVNIYLTGLPVGAETYQNK